MHCKGWFSYVKPKSHNSHQNRQILPKKSRVCLLHSTLLACSNASVTQKWRRVNNTMPRSTHNPKKLWQLELLVRCSSGCHCLSPQVPGSERWVLWLMVARTRRQSVWFCFDVCMQRYRLCVCNKEGIIRKGVDGGVLDFFISHWINADAKAWVPCVLLELRSQEELAELERCREEEQ